jgi:hypothetical protein
MAKPTNPRWRQAFDAVEKPLRERAEAIAGTEEFSRALMLLFGAVTTARRSARGASTYLLHLANLPAHADLRRLARQVGTLENKVEHLAAEVDRVARLLERGGGEQEKRRAK